MKIFTKITIMLSMFLITSMQVFASGFNVIDEMHKLATSEEVQTGAWGLIKPGAVIVLLIIVAAGFALIILAIGYILKQAFKMFQGKGQIGKDELKKTVIGLLIGLAIVGGGIFSIFQTANNVAVEPGVDLIEQQSKDKQDKDQESK